MIGALTLKSSFWDDLFVNSVIIRLVCLAPKRVLNDEIIDKYPIKICMIIDTKKVWKYSSMSIDRHFYFEQNIIPY